VLGWRYGDLPFSRRLEEFELATYDDRMNWRGPALEGAREDPVVIVAIDEVSLGSFSDSGMTYPWPRELHAKLIRQLMRGGAKVVAFDVNFDTVVPAPNQKPPRPDDYFWEPQPCASDLQFAKALKDSGNVVLAAVIERKVVTTEGRDESVETAAYPAPLFDDAAAAHADATTPIDFDGTVRRARTTSSFRDERLVSFPVAVAAAYRAGTPAQGQGGAGGGSRLLGAMNGAPTFGRDESRPYSGERSGAPPSGERSGAPTDGSRKGLEGKAFSFADEWAGKHRRSLDAEAAFPVDFHGPPGTTPTVGYASVLAYGPAELERFRGKIVLVGATAPELHDVFSVPIRRAKGAKSGEEVMPGVEIHANAIRTLLAARCIRPAPIWVAVVWTLLVGCLTGIATFYLRPLPALLTYIPLMAIANIVVAFWLFVTRDLWVNATLPMVGALATSYVASTVFAYFTVERERNHIQRAWAKRVSPEVLQRLVQNPRLQQVAGRTLQATVLFSDLRNFTMFCHAWPPEEVVRRLNEIFDRMTRVITDRGGTLDKFIGDGIMAVFGDPVPHEDHARRALLAAIDMLRAMKELQQSAAARGDEPMRMGIGIHTGELVAGDIGSELFLEYTVIGDTVSTASRLEGLNKDYKTNIICSGDTLAQAGEGIPARLLDTTTVRGRETPLQVYEVLWEKEG
jgi:adenylate cyclase